MKSLLMKAVMLAGIVCVLAQPAKAGPMLSLDDPANLHINGAGGFTQSSQGVDWVTLPTFSGTFNITDVANNGEVVSPWHLVVAIPNVTSGLTDQITRIGATTLATPISNDRETTLLPGQDAYVQLGVPGSGLPNSLSFTNFAIADAKVANLPTPTNYGLFDFTISPASLAIIANGASDDVVLGGGANLPTGSIFFAWGLDANGTTISTAFTNAGVATPFSVNPVPEPASIVMAMTGIVAIGLLVGYRRWRLRLA